MQQHEIYLSKGFKCDKYCHPEGSEWIQVEGEDGRHFSAVIVSEQFKGKSMVQQHQLVYRALRDKMKEDIHALSMKTFTPEQWEEYKQAEQQA